MIDMGARKLIHSDISVKDGPDRFRETVNLAGKIGGFRFGKPALAQNLRRGRQVGGFGIIPQSYEVQVENLTISFCEVVSGKKPQQPAFFHEPVNKQAEERGIIINVTELLSNESNAADSLGVIRHNEAFHIDDNAGKSHPIKPSKNMFKQKFEASDRNRLFIWLRSMGISAEGDTSLSVLPFIRYRSIDKLLRKGRKRDERTLATRLVAEELKFILAKGLFMLQDQLSGSGWKSKRISEDNSDMASFAAAFILSHPYSALAQTAQTALVDADDSEAAFSYLNLLCGRLPKSVFFSDEAELSLQSFLFLSRIYEPRELSKRIAAFGKGIDAIAKDCFTGL